MRQHIACFRGAGRIDRHVTFVNVLNDPVFVDHKSCAITKALFFIEDSIVLHDGAFEIAEYWEGNAELFGELTVGGNTVYAKTKNLSVGCFKFGDISLIRLQFFRSTTSKRQNINRQHDIFLGFEVTELVSLAIGGAQCEIGRLIPNL